MEYNTKDPSSVKLFEMQKNVMKSVCMPPSLSQTHIFRNKYTSLIAVMPHDSYKHTTHVALVPNDLNRINPPPSAQAASPNQVQSATEPSSPYE